MPEAHLEQNRTQARATAGLILVLVEYLVLAVLFDGDELAKKGGIAAHLSYFGESVTAVVVVVTSGLVLGWRRLSEAFRECAAVIVPVSVRWMLAHFLAIALSTACLAGAFSTGAGRSISLVVLMLAWGASGAYSLFALGQALFGRNVYVLLRAIGRVALAGFALGVVALVAALSSRPLWPWLARQTLLVAGALLGLVTDTAGVDSSTSTLSAAGFAVEISPECSGIEGMGLMAVFVLGYLFRSRTSLRFPRSLLLLPLAVALAWTANVARLASLVAVGAWVSPEVAFGGFHSKAGWILFCFLALALVWLAERSRYFSRLEPLAASESTNPTAAYLLPMLVVITVGLLTAMGASVVDLAYSPRVAAAVLVLLCYRRYYAELLRAPGWDSVLVGAFVFLLWVVFAPTPDSERAAQLVRGVAALPPTSQFLWIAFRLVGGIVTIPIVEELAFRGFLQRRLVGDDFTGVRFDQRNLVGVVVSALAFGVLHRSYIAGTLAGLAYSFACYRRGRLMDSVLAHATTNALIAIWVLGFGRWDLWL